VRSPRCLCVCVPPPIVARQRLGKHVHAAKNTGTTIEELLEAVFYMRAVSRQVRIGSKVGD
jgi:alkylhydroperoxidase/carboxymuconolactone decarboxylase family protein YurZ